METTAVTPGQRLGYAEDYIAGAGTYERDGILYASVVGLRSVGSTVDGEVTHPNLDRLFTLANAHAKLSSYQQ